MEKIIVIGLIVVGVWWIVVGVWWIVRELRNAPRCRCNRPDCGGGCGLC